jgi:hypothetical protein
VWISWQNLQNGWTYRVALILNYEYGLDDRLIKSSGRCVEKKQWISLSLSLFYTLLQTKRVGDYFWTLTFTLKEPYPKSSEFTTLRRACADWRKVFRYVRSLCQNDARCDDSKSWNGMNMGVGKMRRTKCRGYYDGANEPKGICCIGLKTIFSISKKWFIWIRKHGKDYGILSMDWLYDWQIRGHVYKNDPIAYLRRDSQIVESIDPYFMGTIVDVEDFWRIPRCDWRSSVFILLWRGSHGGLEQWCFVDLVEKMERLCKREK